MSGWNGFQLNVGMENVSSKIWTNNETIKSKFFYIISFYMDTKRKHILFHIRCVFVIALHFPKWSTETALWGCVLVNYSRGSNYSLLSGGRWIRFTQMDKTYYILLFYFEIEILYNFLFVDSYFPKSICKLNVCIEFYCKMCIVLNHESFYLIHSFIIN